MMESQSEIELFKKLERIEKLLIILLKSQQGIDGALRWAETFSEGTDETTKEAVDRIVAASRPPGS